MRVVLGCVQALPAAQTTTTMSSPPPPPPPPTVHQISKFTVKPSAPLRPPAVGPEFCHLTPWDLARLSGRYIQKGLLFSNLPSSLPTATIVDRLKTSLSATLFHFYPLAGRFRTEHVVGNDGKVTGMAIAIECNSQGAEFIQAAAKNITVVDVLAPSEDVPSFIQSLFPLNGAVNYDGHTVPLVSVQLTELSDGIFLSCSFNHAVGDGNSYWNFFNAWAEITRGSTISKPPVLDRWFPEGRTPPIKLPFSHESEFIERYSPPQLREKIFYFSAHSIARLKMSANANVKEFEDATACTISSFQALCSLVWRSITRARRLPANEKTSCTFTIQNRTRLQPPLSPDYFGNSINTLAVTVTVGELIGWGIGWAALRLHGAVGGHTSDEIRGLADKYCERPAVGRYSAFDKCGVLISSSPRFDVYGCDFGWGKAAALRSGAANKMDGKVMAYPGREEAGSVELEVCLVPEAMAALEGDEEFMAVVSPHSAMR